MADLQLLRDCLSSTSEQQLKLLLKQQSSNTACGLKGVLSCPRLRAALVSLLPFTGLLEGFEFGCLKRIWDARYPEVG